MLLGGSSVLLVHLSIPYIELDYKSATSFYVCCVLLFSLLLDKALPHAKHVYERYVKWEKLPAIYQHVYNVTLTSFLAILVVWLSYIFAPTIKSLPDKFYYGLRDAIIVADHCALHHPVPRPNFPLLFNGFGIPIWETQQDFSKMAFHIEDGDRWFEETQSHIEELDESLRKLLTLSESLQSQRKELAHSGETMAKDFSKMAFHIEDGDRWFEETQSHIEELDESLRKLLTLSESLQSQRKELAHSGETMAKALSMLASCEESTALARALSHLTETEENLAAVNGKQADNDQARLVEAIGEYVSLFGSLKEVFNERARVWQAWQSAQQNLAKKREQKARFELFGTTDKAQSVKEEMDDAVSKMDALEVEFGRLSKWIREEVGRFESQKRKDLRTILIDFIEGMVETQQEILKLWGRFAPETQSIIAYMRPR